MLDLEKLRKRVCYDKDTGLFKSLVKTNRWEVGQVLGTKKGDGYLSIMVEGKNYLLHRLAFLFIEGKLPSGLVDHINCVRDDNRWVNLRHACSTLNARNTLIAKNNTSGVKGVSWHKRAGKWQAFISVDSKPVYLGLFESIEAAEAARHMAKKLAEYPEEVRNV